MNESLLQIDSRDRLEEVSLQNQLLKEQVSDLESGQ